MDQERVRSFFDSRADSYLARSHRGLWDRFRQKEFEGVVKLLGLREGLSLLDVGSGAGYYAIRLQKDFGMEVLAADLSPRMIEQLRGNGVRHWHGDFANYEGSEEFDRVLIAGMLEFAADPEAIFKKAYQSLKKGGRLVALIPRGGLPGWAYALAHVARGCPTRILPRSEYRRLASHAGFSFIEEIRCTSISQALSWVK